MVAKIKICENNLILVTSAEFAIALRLKIARLWVVEFINFGKSGGYPTSIIIKDAAMRRVANWRKV